ESGGDLELPRPPFVVKPAVSNGAQDTAWYRAGDEDVARCHVRRLLASGRAVLIQPYLADVETEGEAALVFIGGRSSPSCGRGAALRGRGSIPEGAVPPSGVGGYEPTPAERALAERVLACAPGGPSGLLFGRVDLVTGAGRDADGPRGGADRAGA